MQLSVILVTHNSSQWLPAFANSWREAATNANFTDFETILADTASTDDTLTTAQREFPAAKILPLQNIGYGPAANRAAARWRNSALRTGAGRPTRGRPPRDASRH